MHDTRCWGCSPRRPRWGRAAPPRRPPCTSGCRHAGCLHPNGGNTISIKRTPSKVSLSGAPRMIAPVAECRNMSEDVVDCSGFREAECEAAALLMASEQSQHSKAVWATGDSGNAAPMSLQQSMASSMAVLQSRPSGRTRHRFMMVRYSPMTPADLRVHGQPHQRRLV